MDPSAAARRLLSPPSRPLIYFLSWTVLYICRIRQVSPVKPVEHAHIRDVKNAYACSLIIAEAVRSMRFDSPGLLPGVTPASSTARTTSGLHRSPHSQPAKARAASGRYHDLPDSGRNEAIVFCSMVWRPCREYGRMCSA